MLPVVLGVLGAGLGFTIGKSLEKEKEPKNANPEGKEDKTVEPPESKTKEESSAKTEDSDEE